MMSCSGLAGHRVLRGRAAENVGRHCCRFGLKEACGHIRTNATRQSLRPMACDIADAFHVAPTQLQEQHKVLRHKGKELRCS
jgi:hypothetical protein